jgi:hypothetical protein
MRQASMRRNMVSVGLALLSFAVLSAFVVVIVRGMN